MELQSSVVGMGMGGYESRGRGRRTRDALLGLIKSAPGIHKSELARRAGLAWGTIGHHLHVMHKEGRVRLVQAGKQLHVLPVSQEVPRSLPPSAVMPLSSAILSELSSRPHVGLTELGRILSVEPRRVRRHLQALARDGFVYDDRAYRPRFFLSDGGVAMLDSLPDVHARVTCGVDSPGNPARS